MFEEGQIFNKDGDEYCVLDVLEYEGKTFVLFSIESGKVGFSFYQVDLEGDNYNLVSVIDDNLNNILMNMYEEKNNEKL